MESFLHRNKIGDRQALRNADKTQLLTDLNFTQYDGLLTDNDESLMSIISKKVDSKLQSLLRNNDANTKQPTLEPRYGNGPVTRARFANLGEAQAAAAAVALPPSMPGSPSPLIVYNNIGAVVGPNSGSRPSSTTVPSSNATKAPINTFQGARDYSKQHSGHQEEIVPSHEMSVPSLSPKLTPAQQETLHKFLHPSPPPSPSHDVIQR